MWASSIITRARKEGRIRDDFAVKTLIDELNKFRGQCGLLLSFDTISVPLVYTQVRAISVLGVQTLITSLGSDFGSIQLLPDDIDGPSMGGQQYLQIRLVLPRFHDAAVLFLRGLVESG